MNRTIYELPQWPRFTWDINVLATPLAEVRHMQGRYVGRMEALRSTLCAEAVLDTMVQDIMLSSEMDGLFFDEQKLHAALSKKLGNTAKKKKSEDEALNGVVDIALDASQYYAQPITEERLKGWHAKLFPTGFNGARRIKVGAWRDPRKGEFDRNRVAREMNDFINWFENDDGTDGVLRAGIAHIWFMSIQPFDAGNGHIARMLSDMMLARTEKTTARFYSMSALLRADQQSYQDALERAQKGSLDLTAWLAWYLLSLSRAIEAAKEMQASVFQKALFWDEYATTSFNKRQRKVIDLLLAGDDKPLTTSRWAKLNKCSQDSALRDIQALIELKILAKDPAGGRSTKYYLAA